MLALVLSFWFAIALLFSITGCTTTPGPAAEKQLIKYDMKAKVNGTTFDGVGVVPVADSYDMYIEAREDVDLLTVDSCHRSFSVESAITLDWFESKRGYHYRYDPSRGIEDQGSCLVRIGAYNKSPGGQNAWALLDFATPEAALPAAILCDGARSTTGGVSICQTREGLLQRVVFDTPVHLADAALETACKVMQSKDQTTWEYAAPLGECVFAFQETGGQHRLHRHTSVGFNQILIRGAQ